MGGLLNRGLGFEEGLLRLWHFRIPKGEVPKYPEQGCGSLNLRKSQGLMGSG